MTLPRKHMPCLPFIKDQAGNGQITIIDSSYLSRHMAYIPHDCVPEEEIDDLADFFVRACNSHAALVEALEMYMEVGDQCSRGYLGQCEQKAEAALALAKGG